MAYNDSGNLVSRLLRFQFVIYLISLIVVRVAAKCTTQDEIGCKTSSYPLSKESPVIYDVNNLKYSLLFSVPENSIIKGNISIAEIKSKTDCKMPTRARVVNDVGFYSLNLTKLENAFQNTLEISVESEIPTFFNLDPYSYVIYVYNPETNMCQQPEYSKRNGPIITFSINSLSDNIIFGVFVFQNIESVAFEKSISIHFPRSIIYMCEGDLKFVSYTFPRASYMIPEHSPCMSVYRYYIPYSDIPEGYYIFARFQVSMFSQPLNLTDSYVAVGFLKRKFFTDIRNNLVEVSMESLACYFLIDGNFHQVKIEYNDMAGVVKCHLQQGFNVDHEMFILGKAKDTRNPLSSSEYPSPLIENTTERIVLARGQSKIFKIGIPKGSRLLLQLEGPPLPVFLASGYIPNPSSYFKKLTSTGYYNSDPQKPTCFILFENNVLDTYIVSVTPTIEFIEAETVVDNNTLTIVFAVLSSVLCLALIPLVAVLILVVRRNTMLTMEANQEGNNQEGYGSFLKSF